MVSMELKELPEQWDLRVPLSSADEYKVESSIYSIREVPVQEYGHEEMYNEQQDHKVSKVSHE